MAERRRKKSMTGEGLLKGKAAAQLDAEEESPLPPSARKKRRGFSEEGVALIADYFSHHIATRNFPTSLECRDFVALYKTEFYDRSPNDIYDKCCNIAGHSY